MCNKCGKLNHFAAGCLASDKRQNVNELQYYEVNDFYVDAIQRQSTSECWVEFLKIGGNEVKFKLDSGADCNVLPIKIFNALEITNKPKIKEANITLESYFKNKRRARGYVILDCKLRNVTWQVKFILFETDSLPILGRKACERMQLVTRMNAKVEEVKCKSLEKGLGNGNDSKSSVVRNNKDLFEGIGAYPDKYKIILREDSQPVVNSSRRIPLALKDRLKDSLDKLEKREIIEKVDYATDWVNNVIIVEKKDGSIRICLDPGVLNKNLKTEKFPIPTIDELSTMLTGKEIFSVLDMKDGFHQIMLDEKSSDICTFITPYGKYKYKRLPFGLSTAPEVFQRMNVKIFGDIQGVCIYFDDMIVAAASEEEHDLILEKVFERARKYNVRFNATKLQYKVSEVRYLGLIFNKCGVKPDPNMVETIVKLKEPANKKELLSILGMFNFLAKFVKNESDLCAPLRELIKKNVDWHWTPDHAKCLAELKKALCNAQH